MALSLTNNTYNGVLTNGLSALISIGATDYALWHSATTNGNKVRLPYVDAAPVLVDITSAGLCSLTDGGSRTLDFINMTLTALAANQTACIDELYGTDYANAQVGYASQDIDSDLANAWALRIADKFSKAMENLRWSGNTTLAATPLVHHDGIVRKIQALGAWVISSNEVGYQKVATTAVTAGNVVAEIVKVLAVLPHEVKAHAGFKIVVAPGVANFLKQASMQATGVNNIVFTGADADTGLLTDNFFGYKVYVAKGLGATVANNNVILAGIFEDSADGVIKWGMNTPSDEKNLELKLVSDGDKLRFRIAAAQAVAVIPNGSQIAMNI